MTYSLKNCIISHLKQSQLFAKTIKENPKDEESKNAQLLIRAGFIDKVMAGVYNYLPLGYQVIKKIEQIVREEMERINGQELLMPVLHPKENWQQTNRWDTMSVLFRLKTEGGKELALGPTHEEIVTPLAKKNIFSYKDLPVAVFQIQNKFRNEARSKSGVLRGREFLMKDLYSFHINEEDLNDYYRQVEKAYEKIWQRLDIGAITYKTYATGGDFTKFSHEYQTVCPTGEDTIYLCPACQVAVNKEIYAEQNTCPECGRKDLVEQKAIEVGNIFQLKDKFSQPFHLTFKDRDGQEKIVYMGCYGIGISRLLGTLAEVFNDQHGLMWPSSVAPFAVHLLNLKEDHKAAEKIYQSLIKQGIAVLYDDRLESAGVKLNDADLIGLPHRLIISDKSDPKIEYKKRTSKTSTLMTLPEILAQLS